MVKELISETIRILHIDDEINFLDMTKAFLELEYENKFQIDFLIDPHKTIQQLHENTYDVVISDYEMPSKNGLEVLTDIRKSKKFRNLPVIIFTGRGREEVAIKALNIGASYYINKGVDIESQYRELVHAIDMVVTQKRTQLALKQSEKEYRQLVQNLPVGVFKLNLEAEIQFAHVVDFPESKIKGLDIINTSAFNLIHPSKREEIKRMFDRSVQEEIITKGEVLSFANNWLSFSVIPVKKEVDGDVTEVLAIYEIINERKKAELKLKESQLSNQATLDAIPDMIFRFDRNFNIISFRGSDESLYVPPDLFLGKKMSEVLPMSVAKLFEDTFDRILKTNEKQRIEYQLEIQGEFKDFEARIVYLFEKGEILAIIRDITTDKEWKKKLESSEEKYRSLFEQTPIALLQRDYSGVIDYFNQLRETGVTDLQTYLQTHIGTVYETAKRFKTVEMNQAALNLFEVESKEEFEKTYPSYFFDSENMRNAFIKQMIRFDKGVPHQKAEILIELVSGKKLFVRIVQAIPEEQKSNFKRAWTSFIDITESRRMKLAIQKNLIELQQSEEKYRTLYDESHDLIFIAQGEKLIDCNRTAVEYFGLTKEDIFNKSYLDLSPEYQPDGQKSSIKGVEKIFLAQSGHSQKFMWRFERKSNNTNFDAAVSLNIVQWSNENYLLVVIRPYNFIVID
jgi:PAS domain S-box-containing protein